MSITVKKLGCSNLKALLEDDKLTFKDFDILRELTTFIQRKQSWEADDGLGEDTFIDGEGNLWEYGSSEVDVEYMWNY